LAVRFNIGCPADQARLAHPWQMPLTQLALGWQMMLQPPQFDVVVGSTHIGGTWNPRAQLMNPPVHSQFPETHAVPEGQMFPHVPQDWLSHAPSQTMLPVGQEHRPFEQVAPLAQVVPQLTVRVAPQLSTAVTVVHALPVMPAQNASVDSDVHGVGDGSGGRQ